MEKPTYPFPTAPTGQKKSPKAIYYCKLRNATKNPREFHFSTHPQNLLGRDKSINLSDI